MASTSRDPYKILGVDKSADLAAIKTAYRKLVLRCHPDKVQDPALKAVKQDEFQRVQQAYEILSDETKRDEYDEDAKLKKMREEASQKLREDVLRNMARTSAPPQSPKNYNETTRAAEQPSSFKPTSQPGSPFSPYRSGGLHFSHSWDRDIPIRTKPAVYEEEHRARRTSSHDKSRDEHKEERRRRKDDEYDWLREKDRERERTRDRDRDRDRDREKRSRADREKDDKKEKSKREIEKREKERDRLRRQDQQEKHRAGKNAYPEPYYDSEDDHHAGKRKPTTGGVGASSTPGKKHSSSPRRDKSSRRDESPRVQSVADKTPTDKMSDTILFAAEYMTKRRGAKPGAIPSHLPENVAYSTNFADPGAWHTPSDMPRSRRPSHDEKKYRARADALDPEVEEFMGRPTEFRSPPLSKSNTLPAGAMHMPSSSMPRPPGLTRSATVDYSHEHYPPVVPAPPPAESSRHSSKSERRRKGSLEVYEDDLRPRRSPGQPRVLRVYDDVPPLLRTASTGHYRSSGEVYYHQTSVETPRRTGFEKIKVAPAVSPDKVYYQTKRFSDEDIAYSSVKHSSSQYPSPHSYMPVRS